jgi:uncharacterized membrane protein YkvA (DUF1232 family)
MWWHVALGALITIAALWLIFIVVLLVARPRGIELRDALRILPDVLRLLHRLARDNRVPRGVRTRLWLLLGYLAFPIDFVPDFLPVIGYADDVIITMLVLRSVVRRAGVEPLRQHWSGSEAGLAIVLQLAGVPNERRLER